MYGVQNKNKKIYIDQDRLKHRFHLMIKAIGARCNLDCTYCYYLHKQSLLKSSSDLLVMSDDTLETMIAQYIESNEHKEVVFSWQGGEPTLLGVSFFEKAMALQEKYNVNKKNIANTLQTNGTLIDANWAKFLKEHDFLVGLSIDGPENLHNKFRLNKSGEGSFKQVMQGLEYLQAHDVPFTTLSTINSHNVKYPLEVYSFLTKTLGSSYVQFNPCVEPLVFTSHAPKYWGKKTLPYEKQYINSSKAKKFVTQWSVIPEDWGIFLCTIFDEWLEHDLGHVLVNWFETAVAQAMGLPAQLCTTGEICGKGVAIERDGSVYSCDHYVNAEYCLGNIQDKPLRNLVFSAKQQDFAFQKQQELAFECLHCVHGTWCWGQCPRHRFVKTAQGIHPLNYLCIGFKQFYDHAKPQIKQIANLCLQGNMK